MRSRLLHLAVLTGFLLLMHLSALTQASPGVNFAALRQVALWSPETENNVLLLSKGNLTALVLFSPDCPMCINYTQPLNSLQQQLGSGIQVLGIVPGKTYTDDVVLNFSKLYQLNFPLYVDRQLLLTKLLTGEVTPEVFLFNASGQLVYRGAIDNWLVGLGQKKQKPDQFFLLNAIDQTLSDQVVRVPYVKAQGCILNDY